MQEALKPDLLKILVKNCQTAKSILNEASNEVRSALVALLTSAKEELTGE